MPFFSKQSRDRLATCDPRIQRVFNEVIKHFDCTVTEGHRPTETQLEYFKKGRKLINGKWVIVAPKEIITNIDGVSKKGNHNYDPSRAVDVTPFPVNYGNHTRQVAFAGFVLGIAKMMGIKLRWGGDWNRNWETRDEHLSDFPHFERDEP